MAKGLFNGAFKGIDAFGKVSFLFCSSNPSFAHNSLKFRLWMMSRSRPERGVSVRLQMLNGLAIIFIPSDIVTMLSAILILSFTFMEFIDYRRVYVDTSVLVDRSRGERLTVVLNVTFPKVPCYRRCIVRNHRVMAFDLVSVLSIDVTDISGDLQLDLSHNIAKTRLTSSGRPVLAAPKQSGAFCSSRL